MPKKEASKWWFDVRYEHSNTTESFDTFNKSSKLSAVLTAVARRFDLPRSECLIIHKGKIQTDGSKALIDCGIDRAHTVILHRRYGFNPVNPSITESNEDVEDAEAEQLPTSPSDTEEEDLTTCPECGLSDGDQTIVCDECNNWWHWDCCMPRIKLLPKGDWFCANCKNDGEEVIRPDNELGHKAQKKMKKTRKTKDWSRGGMSNQGFSRLPPVSLLHRGHIPGIDVGQSWEKRIGCAEDGVHRAPMAGIVGAAKTGAVSICMGKGYDTNEDYGDWFLYTGRGGGEKKNSAAPRTKAKQVMDQELKLGSLAIATTCDAVVDPKGAVAKNWRNSKPIRVVRKHDIPGEYAPAEGYRYDGLYKVVKYFLTEPLPNGFRRYIFEFRRDDDTPMPWTPAGKKVIEQLGLRMREASKPDEMKSKQMQTYQESPSQPPKIWNIPQSVRIAIAEAISATPSHRKIFEPLLAESFPGKYELVQFLRSNITCPICQRFVEYPVTNSCGHVACLKCLQECGQSEYGCRCTLCGVSWLADKTTSRAPEVAKQMFLEQMKVDKYLVEVLELCFGCALWTDIDSVEADSSNRKSAVRQQAKSHRKKVENQGPGPSQGTSDSIAESNRLVRFFASESRVSSGSSEASAPEKGTHGNPIPMKSLDTQEILDQQLFEGMDQTGPEDSYVKNRPRQLGFRELQALHYAHHNPPISESAVNEYRRVKRAEVDDARQLKRSFSQMETRVEGTVSERKTTIEDEPTRKSRTRSTSAKGLTMESSLRMF